MANVNRKELLDIVTAYAPEVAEELVNDIMSSGVLEPYLFLVSTKYHSPDVVTDLIVDTKNKYGF